MVSGLRSWAGLAEFDPPEPAGARLIPTGRWNRGVFMTKGHHRTPSRQTLERGPGRVVTFLRAAGGWPSLAQALSEGGFGPKHHAEGLRLLGAACACAEPSPERRDAESDASARAALKEIEAWVATHFRRFQVTLRRVHPDAPSPFLGIEQPERRLCLPALATLLERLRLLEGDHPAGPQPLLLTLEERGLTATERARLAACVQTARVRSPVLRRLHASGLAGEGAP